MDNIDSPQSPPKTGGHGGSVGSGKKKERRKTSKKSKTFDEISASSPNANLPQEQKETVVIGDKNDDHSHTRQDAHVLQDKSNVESLSMNPSADPNEDKIQKPKQKQEQRNPKSNEKEGSQQTDPPKSKKELAAERRKKQEAQRAAKLEKQRKAQGGEAVPAKTTPAPDADGKKKKKKEESVNGTVEDKEKTSQVTTSSEITEKDICKMMTPEVELFSHLKLNLTYSYLIKLIPILKSSHPDIVKFGLQCSLGFIRGSNARCVGLLTILKRLVSDYVTPADKDLCRDFSELLHEELMVLDKCRRLSVSMENAFRHLRWNITNMSRNTPESQAKEELLQVIDNYIMEKVDKADDAILIKALEKIENGDVIAIFSASSLILKILVRAKQEKKEFSVIVVDSRPHMEGQKMLLSLVKEDIKCTYVLISAISYTLQKATKVFLGAHGFLSNGFVMSRVGSSLLCLMAKSYNIPVLVFCESHKFSERVQTDSFVVNELCDPEELVYLSNRPNLLNNWHSFKSLHLLNLVYDVTPSELVTVVITELGAIPCSSIPVVLRVQQEPYNHYSATKISNV